MKRVFIIHGWGGNPKEGWIPWLKQELEKNGLQVHTPQMPHTETPKIQEWVEELNTIVGKADEDTYFVGGSIGCQTILRYIETLPEKVGGAVFVAGWFNLENLEPEEIEIAKSWISETIDLKRVKDNLPKSTLIISDNDPFGSFEYNKAKFSELGSKIIVMNNAGHISGEDGFSELPIALEELTSIIK